MRLLNENNIAYTDEIIANCEKYYLLVIKGNERTNLTRITSEMDAAAMHFFGALMLLKFFDLPKESRVIDVGTGAGFPGVPLKIARNDIELTLLDSSRKKTEFLLGATKQMGMDAAILNLRAEDANDIRESFDVALSRAVAVLPILTELCVPFIKVGGYFCAWKGEKYKQELHSAKNAIATLNCSVSAVHSLGTGAIIIMQKNKPAPEMYPRRFAKIKSAPL